jgi:hypothetical protein
MSDFRSIYTRPGFESVLGEYPDLTTARIQHANLMREYAAEMLDGDEQRVFLQRAVDDDLQGPRWINIEAQARKLPADPEGQNCERATWAGIALQAFQNETDAEDTEAVHDLLTDLRHLCDRTGRSWQEELEWAMRMYADQTGETGASA